MLSLRALFGAGLLLSATVMSVHADTGSSTEHNCAGTVVSSLAGQGFGQAVSSLAHQQLVDNLGLADCGAPPRNNP
jgi:hypothetical protein